MKTKKQETQHNRIMDENLSRKKKVLHIFIVLLGVAFFFGGIYLILYLTGLIEYVNSVEKIKSLILGMGFYGRSIFVLLQFLQVTFLPLPASMVVIAGTLVYGPLEASLLSLSGILLGSTLAFFLGKTFGKKLVVFMVGKESCDKWVKFLDNGKYSYVIMMLLPFFPDDVLCLVAGVTNMSWLFFVVTQFLTRPVGIITTAYFSSGEIIPYHGWGLVVWGIIIVATIVLIILTTKYKNQIENCLSKAFRKKKEDKRLSS